eukprot:gb/GECH01011485.1/.p1 GENE.gb/GECH01011485.1/~~gb/GECH01011485.1/.p1  ORF type:complete len:605 (+),score=160.18 gb/GECH01011485.1/:1-1815(+)
MAAPPTPNTPAAGTSPVPTPPAPSASLYVGDLDPDVTESQLFDHFHKIGPIVSIRVCRDAITRRSLGYAYVNFQAPQDAERALDTLNYSTLKDKPIRIMWTNSDPSIRKSGRGNVYIKNLDKSIDNQQLHDTFSAFGNILSCKVATDEAGKSKGFGFVHFETQEAADKAIKKVNGMRLGNSVVYVGPFIRKSERIKENANKWTNVFFKNTDENITQEDVDTAFGKFGDITKSAYYPRKMKDKGYGFVNFKNHDDAVQAVNELNEASELNGKPLEGKLTVTRAQKKEERHAMLRKEFEQKRWERLEKYQGVNLYIKHLDDKIDDEALKEEFSRFGNIHSAKVMRDDKGQSKGFGFVCFKKPEEASAALNEMNGKMVEGKPIYVALAQRKEVRKAQLEAQYAQRQPMPPGGMPGGVPPQMYPPTMFYPGMPTQPRQYIGYPQQMPARPRFDQAPRGAPKGGRGGGGGYPVPGYPVMGGGRGGGRQRGGGGPHQKNGNIKFNKNVRNKGEGAPSDIDVQALAQASPEEKRNILGMKLYPLVEKYAEPSDVPKVTGMLLEMNHPEILHLLESAQALKEAVDGALTALKEATPQNEGGEQASKSEEKQD